MEATQTSRTETPADAHIARLEAKIDALTGHVGYLVERQRWQADLVDEMMPILRLALNVSADHLHGMDQKGYFTFGREALQVVERIVESYSEDDVRALGAHIVGIMDTVKNITQPAILQVANEATEVLQHADDVEPLGMMGMMRATRDDDTQKGMAIVFEVLRQIGRTASASADPDQEKARLEASTQPFSPHPTRPRAANRRPAAPSNGVPSNGAPSNGAPPNGVPSGGAAEASGEEDGDGWKLTDAGHLADPEEWDRQFAAAMAMALGLGALCAEQWEVVEAARQEWVEAGASPNIRRLTAVAGVTTKELYILFPKAPGRTVSKIAGIPKPVGCL